MSRRIDAATEFSWAAAQRTTDECECDARARVPNACRQLMRLDAHVAGKSASECKPEAAGQMARGAARCCQCGGGRCGVAAAAWAPRDQPFSGAGILTFGRRRLRLPFGGDNDTKAETLFELTRDCWSVFLGPFFSRARARCKLFQSVVWSRACHWARTATHLARVGRPSARQVKSVGRSRCLWPRARARFACHLLSGPALRNGRVAGCARSHRARCVPKWAAQLTWRRLRRQRRRHQRQEPSRALICGDDLSRTQTRLRRSRLCR